MTSTRSLRIAIVAEMRLKEVLPFSIENSNFCVPEAVAAPLSSVRQAFLGYRATSEVFFRIPAVFLKPGRKSHLAGNMPQTNNLHFNCDTWLEDEISNWRWLVANRLERNSNLHPVCWLNLVVLVDVQE